MEKQSSDSPVCPKCNSTNVAKYLWGLRLLSDQLERDIEEGRVILGGCVVCVDDPKFHCNDCKYDWRQLQFWIAYFYYLHRQKLKILIIAPR